MAPMRLYMILLLLALGIAIIACVPLRILLFNPIQLFHYGVKDIYEYIKYKSWKYAPVGFLHAYVGLFGQGKTLSSVNFTINYFKRYNDRKVYDPFRHKYVTQYVNVLSNVHLPDIPYTEFNSMSQIVQIAEEVRTINEDNDIRIVTLVLGDEFSVQMNSRNFKSNIDPLMLNAILTCRHHGISLVYTAQRFQHVDALLRQVTERVIECKKRWRVQCLNYYDAWSMENVVSTMQLKPIQRTGFFVTDNIYNQYDSISTVKNLIREYKEGNILDEETILTLQGYKTKEENKRGRKRRKDK